MKTTHFSTPLLVLVSACAQPQALESDSEQAAVDTSDTATKLDRYASELSISSGWAQDAALQLQFPGSELDLDAVAARIPSLDLLMTDLDLGASLYLLPSTEGSRSITDSYGIAVDPDAFPPRDGLWHIRVVESDGAVSDEFLEISEERTDLLPVPIFMVKSPEEVALSESSETGEGTEEGGACAAPPPAATTYLCLCGVYLTDSKDTGDDEFELHMEVGSSSGASYVYFPTYSGMNGSSGSSYRFTFDWSTVTDMEGRSRMLNDIDEEDMLYCADGGDRHNGIALAYYGSCYVGILPIESDEGAGEYRPGSAGSSGTIRADCGATSSANYKSLSGMAYATPSGTSSGTTSAYVRYSTVATVNGDDNYGGVFLNFTSSTSSSVRAYTAGHVTLYMARASTCEDVCDGWSEVGSCVIE